MDMLKGFDRITAAGILARAALSMAYVTTPTANAVANEDQVRAGLIEEARHHLGLLPDDYNEPTIERIADYLDQQADELIQSSPEDVQSALNRLAARGDLPSDLYELDIVQNIPDLHGRGFALEKKLIEGAVQRPDFEQHFGKPAKPTDPAMVSLFARFYRTRWPLRDFIMLVGAQRKQDTRLLTVSLAWRIYPSEVDLSGTKNPLEWLQKFTDVYGAEIEVNGRRAKFFNYAEVKQPLLKKLEVGGKDKPREIMMTFFSMFDDRGQESATLISAIDSDKYLATLKALGVKESDVMDV